MLKSLVNCVFEHLAEAFERALHISDSLPFVLLLKLAFHSEKALKCMYSSFDFNVDAEHRQPLAEVFLPKGVLFDCLGVVVDLLRFKSVTERVLESLSSDEDDYLTWT